MEYHSVGRIVQKLSKISDYQVTVDGDITNITYGNKIKTHIQIPRKYWTEIDRRVKLRKSYPDFNKLNSVADLVNSALGCQNLIKRLQTQSGTKSILCTDSCLHIIHIPPDILVEALIANKYHYGPDEHDKLIYCSGLDEHDKLVCSESFSDADNDHKSIVSKITHLLGYDNALTQLQQLPSESKSIFKIGSLGTLTINIPRDSMIEALVVNQNMRLN